MDVDLIIYLLFYLNQNHTRYHNLSLSFHHIIFVRLFHKITKPELTKLSIIKFCVSLTYMYIIYFAHDFIKATTIFCRISNQFHQIACAICALINFPFRLAARKPCAAQRSGDIRVPHWSLCARRVFTSFLCFISFPTHKWFLLSGDAPHNDYHHDNQLVMCAGCKAQPLPTNECVAAAFACCDRKIAHQHIRAKHKACTQKYAKKGGVRNQKKMLLQTMLPQMVFLLATTALATSAGEEKPQQNCIQKIKSMISISPSHKKSPTLTSSTPTWTASSVTVSSSVGIKL